MTTTNTNHTSLKDSPPNLNLDSTNLDDSVEIATPVSQRSGSFTEQEASLKIKNDLLIDTIGT